MKKLLVLTAVTALLASAGGCRCLDGFCRGSAYPAAGAVYEQPCAPACAPACDPCGGAPGAVMAPTTTYVPGPVN